jgi:hypothetical protein
VSGGEFPAATKPDAGVVLPNPFSMAHGLLFALFCATAYKHKIATLQTRRGKAYSKPIANPYVKGITAGHTPNSTLSCPI